VVHIPDECAADVAAAAHEVWRREGETMRRIASPDFRVGGVEVRH
jgi:hypothetical protein